MISLRHIAPPDWMTAAATRYVMTALSPAGKEPRALFVGGCVRNALLNLPVTDIDIATLLTPTEVIARLDTAGIKPVPTGIEHGTVTAVCEGRPFEITTLRRDVETDGRRAIVAFSNDWREDAERRDFTMNTLLADLDGNIYDPLERGVIDAENGRVIFVGDPAQRIAEDYLRILRFFRFHAYYGRGAPDGAALTACRAASDHIPKLSRERITQEMARILMGPSPADTLKLMFDFGVLRDLAHPEFEPAALKRLAIFQARAGKESLAARLAVLTAGHADIIASFEKYLVLTRAWQKELAIILDHAWSLDQISAKTARDLIYQHKQPGYQTLLVYAAIKNADYPALLHELRDWEAPALPLSGDDVQKMGIKAGPKVGEALRAVEHWWMDGGFLADHDACVRYLKEWKDRT